MQPALAFNHAFQHHAVAARVQDATQAPLVCAASSRGGLRFELRIGDEVNTGATTALAALGYRPYRSLPTAALLVPCDSDSLTEPWELNCFAAKPDRAADLAAQGFLLDAVRPWSPDSAAREAGLTLLKAQMFSTPISPLLDAPGDATKRHALAREAAGRMSRD